jgi:signal-transduction protein with cAMP-binding, CBS, and nucleotidyltransferase domain
MTQLLVEDVVRDRGSDQLYTVPAWATVGDAVDLMAEREIGAVLVMTEDELVGGIFTERDLLMRVVKPGRDARSTPISLVMTREVRFVTPGTTVEAAMALMHLQRHRHLLVMEGPTVHGLLSMRDLVFQVVRYGQRRLSGDPLPEHPGISGPAA